VNVLCYCRIKSVAASVCVCVCVCGFVVTRRRMGVGDANSRAAYSSPTSEASQFIGLYL